MSSQGGNIQENVEKKTAMSKVSVKLQSYNYANLPGTHHYLADKPQFLADVVVSSDRVIESPLRPFSQSVMSRNIVSSQVNLSKLTIKSNSMLVT